MNPLELRVQQLEELVRNMRAGKDMQLIENMKRRSLQGVILSGVRASASPDVLETVDEGGTSVYNVAKAPTTMVRVLIEGVPYYIGLYQTT